LRNVYGWFVRVERSLYDLTDLGRAALIRWPKGASSLGHAMRTQPDLSS